MPDFASHLTRAWNYSVSPKHEAPSVEDCMTDVPLAELTARRKELLAVAERDHVARVHLAFIERVIAAIPVEDRVTDVLRQGVPPGGTLKYVFARKVPDPGPNG